MKYYQAGRYQVNNPFISHECDRTKIEPAPIETRLHETYGQCNEDLIIEAMLLAHCWRQKKDLREIHYIDIGGNHPFQTSATYLFYRLYGAHGVLVDANPKMAENLRAHRPHDKVLNCAVSATHDAKVKFFIAKANELSSMNRDHMRTFERGFGDMASVAEEIEVDNVFINDFMAEHAANGVDYLSIDVEGVDFPILQAMDMEKYRPAFLQLEHSDQLQPFIDLLEPRDYICLAVTEVNQIFADRRVLGLRR